MSMDDSKPDILMELADLLQAASGYANAGDWQQALRLSELALAKDTDNPVALYIAGLACAQLGRNRDAIDHLAKSIIDDEKDTSKLAVLATLLQQEGRTAESVQYLERCCRLDPNPDTLNVLGAACADVGRIGDAIKYFRESLRLQPQGNIASAGLYPLLRSACEWGPELEALSRDIDRLNADALASGKAAAEPPFNNIHRIDDPAQNFRVARSWSAALSGGGDTPLPSPPSPASGESNRRLRIGYLSADFHDHATAHLMRGLFQSHDKSRFEIHAYSYGPDDGSRYREAIRLACDFFYDISSDSDAKAARRIRHDGIDILVDLKGHTRHNRLAICAARPSPIQATYLGFPGTTGADFFDYALTDIHVTPPAVQKYYSENLVYLPNSYQCNDDTQKIPLINNKEIEKIKNIYSFLFCSFNNPNKIDPIFFSIWLSLLKSIPNSALWILQNNPLAERNLKAAAKRAGVDEDRLLFAGMVSRREHLARMAAADLALDTRYYNGHTTTSDALWAGLPVLTMEGNHFASRVSASLLRAMYIPELITQTPAEYAERAYFLATTTTEIKSLREKIVTNRKAAPLFDTLGFTRNLEVAYLEMWRRHCAGSSPAPFSLS